MKIIYYGIGVFYILHELGWIVSPMDKSKQAFYFLEEMKKYKHLPTHLQPKSYKNMLSERLPLLLYLVWLIAGVMTFQWIFFAIYLVWEILIMGPIFSIYKTNKMLESYAFSSCINAVIGVIFALFVMMNTFHFRIGSDQVIDWFSKAF